MDTKGHANDNGPAQRTAGLDERIGSLFQPDTLLAEDYAANFRRKIPLEAERTLLLAVLEDGIRCFKKISFAARRQTAWVIRRGQGLDF